MNRTTDIKERADTPRGWSLLGAMIGAGVGSMLMKKAFVMRRQSSGEGLDMPSLVPAPEGGLMRPTGDLRGTAFSGSSGDVSTGADNLKDKTSELKERAGGFVDQAREKAQGLREHIPDRGEIKARASDWYDTVSDNPVLLAMGGLAIGALFASFIPVTARERQLIDPAKSKVRERISELGDQLESKLSSQTEEERGREAELQSSAAVESEQERGSIPPLPPLDDYTSLH